VLKALIKSKTSSALKHLPFLQFPNTVSEFIPKERTDKQEIREEMSSIKHEILSKLTDLSGINKVYSTIVFNLLDLQLQHAYVTHTNLLFAIHTQGITAWRANELPLAFVSPTQLAQKLEELKTELPRDLELVWDVDDANRYYKSDGAERTLYEDGGVLSLHIPLRGKESSFVLYRFHPLSFGRGNSVCDFKLESALVLKDKSTNLIYPVSDFGMKSIRIRREIIML